METAREKGVIAVDDNWKSKKITIEELGWR